MPSVASVAMAVGPWAVVATLGFLFAFLAFVIWRVGSAKTNMSVRITWKSIEIRRGPVDPETRARPQRHLRSIDPPDAG
jgi:hypothetical protein